MGVFFLLWESNFPVVRSLIVTQMASDFLRLAETSFKIRKKMKSFLLSDRFDNGEDVSAFFFDLLGRRAIHAAAVSDSKQFVKDAELENVRNLV